MVDLTEKVLKTFFIMVNKTKRQQPFSHKGCAIFFLKMHIKFDMINGLQSAIHRALLRILFIV